MRADIYTPWKERPAHINARHVGREEVLTAIQHSLYAVSDGQIPIAMYLFGPRGIGKSHLIALSRNRCHECSIQVATIGEDIPLLRSATTIIERIARAFTHVGPRWQSWSSSVVGQIPQSPCVVLFEGLDRQLQGMSEAEQQTLRAWLGRNAQLFLLATGITLSVDFTGKNKAFYQHFSPWPIQVLSESDAGALLDKIVGDEIVSNQHWTSRRASLVRLSGGNPRTLVALGTSCSQRPDARSTEHLCSVLYTFTAHYQQQFRDLPGQGQRIVEILALSPREMSPTELSRYLGISPSQISAVFRRLFDNGMVSIRQEGRRSWYRISEPLFRYWLEYRNEEWDNTRIGLISSLFEEIFSLKELVEIQSDLTSVQSSESDDLRHALQQVILVQIKDGQQMLAEWEQVRADIYDAIQREDVDMQRILIKKRILSSSWSDSVWCEVGIVSCLIDSSLHDLVRPSLEFVELSFFSRLSEHLESRKGGSTRPSFNRFMYELLSWWEAQDHENRFLSEFYSSLLFRVFDIYIFRTLRTQRRGRPWKLSEDERAHYSRVPFFRAHFLVHGKHNYDQPLLQPEDIVRVGVGSKPVDGAWLVCAGQRRQSTVLLNTILPLDLSGSSLHVSLPRCLTPHLPSPVTDRRLASLLMANIDLDEMGVYRVLSWAASFADLSDKDWHDLLSMLQKFEWQAENMSHLHPNPLGLFSLKTEVAALSSLGLRAPQRLKALAEIKGLSTASWLVHATVLVQHLQDGTPDQLHPELRSIYFLLLVSVM